MNRLARFIRVPASESQKGFIIALCIVAMSIMAVGLVWQAEIIATMSFRFLGNFQVQLHKC